eukprot:2320960-Pyramimonas_sp.AAC.1
MWSWKGILMEEGSQKGCVQQELRHDNGPLPSCKTCAIAAGSCHTTQGIPRRHPHSVREPPFVRAA